VKVLTAWILLIAAVVAVIAAFAARRSDSAAEPSGLHGTVRELLPARRCPGSEPCLRPARNQEVFFTKGGDMVVARTDQRGRLRLLLKPGRYDTVSLRPASVTVQSGHFDRHDFTKPYGH
jgi:hypothetical protein